MKLQAKSDRQRKTATEIRRRGKERDHGEKDDIEA